jgi:hypothetical protein
VISPVDLESKRRLGKSDNPGFRPYPAVCAKTAEITGGTRGRTRFIGNECAFNELANAL